VVVVEFQVVALWVLDADAVENAKIYATRLDFWPLIVHCQVKHARRLRTFSDSWSLNTLEEPAPES
jgi:hypothetical protein